MGMVGGGPGSFIGIVHFNGAIEYMAGFPRRKPGGANIDYLVLVD